MIAIYYLGGEARIEYGFRSVKQSHPVRRQILEKPEAELRVVWRPGTGGRNERALSGGSKFGRQDRTDMVSRQASWCFFWSMSLHAEER